VQSRTRWVGNSLAADRRRPNAHYCNCSSVWEKRQARGERTKLPRALSNPSSSAIGQFMRTRHALLVSVAFTGLSFAPSLVVAQRTNSRDYQVERSRELRREELRERAEEQRERTRWDAIVRRARTEARSYDLAERSRDRAAERAMRMRVLNEQRQDRLRERTDTMLRERTYRVRR
jgi:DNA anti-recombination protein RmuC